MKFAINKQRFLEKLNISQKAMASKTTMPALAGILITCKDDILTMVTSNTEISIKVTIDDPSLRIEDEGKCLVPGRLFSDLVRKLNGDEVKFELAEDNNLILQGGSSDISLVLYDVEDYPNLNFEIDKQPIRIKASLLKEIIKETTFAASPVDTKPILMGVNFKISGNKILAVSTDSFRLSKRDAVLDEECLSADVIIPAKNLNDFDKILENEGAMVEMLVSSNKVLFKTDNVVFQTRLLEGEYPNAIRLLPTEFPVILKFNKSELASSIDRVATISSGAQTVVVKMNIDESGNVSLMSNTPELGTIRDSIKPEEVVVSAPLQISFSASYFLDALRAFNSQDVYVKFNGGIKPFIFEANNDEGLVELVLPMKSD